MEGRSMQWFKLNELKKTETNEILGANFYSKSIKIHRSVCNFTNQSIKKKQLKRQMFFVSIRFQHLISSQSVHWLEKQKKMLCLKNQTNAHPFRNAVRKSINQQHRLAYQPNKFKYSRNTWTSSTLHCLIL